MIVVSDTTAITNLFQVGQLSLLAAVFGKVIVPPAVKAELSEVPGQWDFIVKLNFIEVKKPADLAAVESYKASLDAGEAESIVLAIEMQADFLVMDEWKGRRIAKQAGLHVIGLIGILLTAKRKGVITEIKPILTTLAEVAGFRLHPSLITDALKEAGEI
jgi:predicted nucleic acid-binding protein